MPKQLSFCLHLLISKRRNCTTPPVWREFGKGSKKKFVSIQTNSITVWTDPNYVGSPNPNKLCGRRCSSSTILPSIFNTCNKIKQKFWHLHQKQDVCLRYLSVPISDFLKFTGMLNSPPPSRPTKGLIIPKTDKVVHYNCRCFFVLTQHIYFASIYRAGDNFNLIVQELGGPQVVRSVFKSMTC